MKFGLLVLFAGTALAAPFWVLDENLPRAEIKEVGCSGSRFRKGQSEVYEYVGETLNMVEGSSKRTTGLRLKASVMISTLSECKFAMMLENVELLSKSMNQDAFSVNADAAKMKKDLESSALGFSMSGNMIHTLYADKDEQSHVLNIKRGILSSLQVDEKMTSETDINGVCDTEITVSGNQVVKSKQLSKCSNRAQNEIALQTSTFKTQSDLKPLDSTSTCKYTLSNGHIETVLCEESHLFKPFSAGYKSPSGAMTTVKQTLAYKGSSNSAIVPSKLRDLSQRTSLVFDHTNEESTTSNTIKDQFEVVMTRLADPAQAMKLSAKQDSAHEFSSLVFLLRKMDNKRMNAVWSKYFDCIESGVCGRADVDLRDVYRQYLLDAVAYCGTSTCISMVHDVILTGQVTGERMNMFLQSIALVGKTTLTMIKDVLAISRKQPSRQAFLTLGTLMSRHCAKSPKDCEANAGPVAQAEKFLEQILGSECNGQENHERVEELLLALKAIGNAKRPVNIQHTLLACAKKSKHANVTSSIFDAFRGMPCDSVIRDELVHFLNDKSTDDESRILAYSTLMKCPSTHVVNEIIESLETEKSKHVASFIWSHLTNTMESSNPENEKTQEIIREATKAKPLRIVDLPFYQFSKSFEKSLHSKSLKTGATAEGHIIYNKDKFLPKTGMFNLKAHVMGYPINMLETKVGVDGLEPVLETLKDMLPKDVNINLGKYGNFTSDFINNLLAKKKQNENMNVNDNLTKMHKAINKKITAPTAHISVKVMGQEIKMLSYDDIFAMVEQIDNMNVVQLLTNVAKGGHKTFSKSLMFLEMTHTVPTGLGLPLKLKLVGSTVSTLELDGKFDIRNMFWGTPSVNINGYVKPSAVMELSGQMGIESQYVSTGMFVNSSMFVSQTIKGAILYKHGQILKVNMDTPDEPIQFVNFSSTPFMFMNEQSELIEGASRKINPDFCMKSQLIGYGLCTSMRLPVAFREYEAPYFPLSGPAHFGMKLVKGDEKLTTFQFLVSMTKKQETTVGKIEFSTPGATYERKVNGEMVFSDIENTKTLVLSTERYGKKASIEWNYNTVSHRAEMVGRTNLFTPKEMISRVVFFNQTENIKEVGLLLSAEYDWYKFEHTTKVVTKTTGYQFVSTTTYYPSKSVTGTVEYNSVEKKVTATLDSNQLNQAVELSGEFVVKGNEQGVVITGTHIQSGKIVEFYGGVINTAERKELVLTANVLGKTAKNILTFYNTDDVMSVENFMTFNGKIVKLTGKMVQSEDTKTVKLVADIVGKKAFTTFVLTNKVNEKSIAMSATAAEKTGDAKLGYYVESELKEWKFDFNLMGKHGELFVKSSSSEGYRTTAGAVFDKYLAGIRGMYTENHGHGKSLCSSVYYGTTEAEKEPVQVCVNFNSLGKEYTHKQVTFVAELMGKNKKGEIVFDLEKHTGHVSLGSELKFNAKSLATNKYSLKYSSDMNNELRMDFVAGNYKGGYKWFSTKTTAGVDAGFEAYVMEKSIAFISKYEKVDVSGSSEMKVKSEVFVNGKVMPVSTETAFIHGNGVSGPSVKLTVGDYSAFYSTLVTYSKSFYGYDYEFLFTKKSDNLFRAFTGTSLSLTGQQKSVKQMFGFSVMAKQYVYGWNINYENRGSKVKMAHAVVLGVQYSTTRKSTVTLLLSNNAIRTKLDVEVEYIPTKKVSHFIKYNKKDRQMDLSVEFLPKMFVTFMSRLDKDNGYSLNTNMNIKWKNFKKSLSMVNTFINNNKKMEVSTGFGKDVSLSLTYEKTNPKALTLAAVAFKYNAKAIVLYSAPNVQLRFVLNNKMMVNVFTSYNKISGDMELAFSNTKTKFFRIVKSFNEMKNEYTFKIFGNEEWINIAKSSGIFKVHVFGKQYVQLQSVMKDDSISVTIAATQMNKEITFTGSLNKNEKSITLSTTTGKNNCGVTLRADWVNMIIAEYLFCNDDKVGVEIFAGKHSINGKIILSPTVQMQVIGEVQDDRIVKVTVQRSEGLQMVNETSFNYKLSKNMCQFALQWNAKSIKNVVDMIKPIIENMMTKTEVMTGKAMDVSREFVMKTIKDAAAGTFEFVNNLDKAFDEINFIAARDNVAELTVKSLKKIGEMMQKSLKAILKALNEIKKNVPELVEQLKDLKVKAKKLSLKATEMVKNLQGDFKKNLKEINAIVMKIAMNLTESTRPVINKAITLIKEFKIRGKPMHELVVLAKNAAVKYFNIYTEQAQLQWAEMKVKGTKLFNKGTKYVMKVKIPYRDETVEQVIEIITDKALALNKKISNIDLEKMIKESRISIMKYKINGKTVTKHLVLLQKDMKNLPEATRKAILQLIKMIRLYSAKADAAFQEVKEFAKPMTNHVVFVGKSINKHFNPLVKSSLSKISSKISSIQLPDVKSEIIKRWQIVEDFFLPLLKPIKPLYENLKQQIRNIRVYGFSIGTLTDLNMDLMNDMVTDYMKISKKALDKQMTKINNIVDTISNMTPEQMVDTAFDNSVKITKDTVVYVSKNTMDVYNKREQMIKDLVSKMKTLYNKMVEQYEAMKVVSINDVMESLVQKSSDNIVATADELTKIVQQLVELEVSKPTWQAWKEANVLGHLGNYGVNQKMLNLIKSAKDVNVTKVALKSIKMIRNYISEVYGEAFLRAVRIYSNMENAYEYIRSIPKKEYEQWFQELKAFTLKNQKDVTSFMKMIYETSKVRSAEMYNKVKSVTEINFNNMHEDYVVPTKQFYNQVAEKSQFVYDDVKQPTIDVSKHYQQIFTKFAEEKYEVVRSIVMKKYKKVFAEMEGKINELKDLVEKKYNEFLSKYGDMTWEQIADKTVELGKAQTKVARKMVMKKYRQLIKKIELLIAQGKEYQSQAMVEYQRYINYLKNEVRPKVEEIVNKYKSMITTETKKYIATVTKTSDELKSKAMKIYNNNKDKTLMNIYLEIKQVIVEQIEKQYALAVKLVNKKTTELKTLTNKYYKKVDVLMRTVILPELKIEAESFINQTLRSSVILGKETVKAYYPHFIVVKEALKDVSKSAQEQSMVAIKESKVMLNKYMAELMTLLRELIEKVKSHEMFKKAINHEFVIKTTEKINEMKRSMEAKLNELKQHPKTLEYKQKLEYTISQLKSKMESYKTEVKQYLEHPNVVKGMETIKKIKKSSLFTITKLVNRYQPFYFELIKLLSKTPVMTAEAFESFLENPEQTFWNAVAVSKDMVNFNVEVMKTFDSSKLFNIVSKMAQKEYKLIANEAFDQWAKDTTKQLYKGVKKTIKQWQNKIQKLPTMIKRMALKNYRQTLFQVKSWCKDQYKSLKVQWKDCPYRQVVTNKLWMEIIDEVANHELVEAVKVLSEMTGEKMMELKGMIQKEMKVRQEMLKMKIEEMKIKLEEVKIQLKSKYEELRTKGVEQYKKLVAEYKNLVKTLKKFVEETTIADIVKFVQTKYIQGVQKFKETQVKLVELKKEYIVKATALYNKYEAEAKKMFDAYYSKAKELALKYKTKFMPIYRKYEAKTMEVYDKYYPIVMNKYNVYKSKAIVKYNELKSKTMELFEEYQMKSLKMMKKAKRQAKKVWMESEVRAKLVTFKGMTIRETIEALKKLPGQTKVFVIDTYNKYRSIATLKVEEIKMKMMNEFMKRQSQFVVLVTPYTTPVYNAYKWSENEVKETALFVYRYYHLAEKYNNANKLVRSEIKRLTPIVRDNLKQYSRDVKDMAQKYAEEYKVKAVQFMEDASVAAGHKTLRTIHSTLKYIDTIDVNQMKSKMNTHAKSFYTAFTKYVSIDATKGEILITIPHSDVTPSFSHHFKKVGEKARRTIRSIKQKGNDMLEKINKQIEDLKIKTEALRAKIEKQIMDNTVELRTDFQTSFKANKQIAIRVYGKAHIYYKQTYKKAMKQYKELTAQAKIYLKKADRLSKMYYQEFIEKSSKAFAKASVIFMDIYETPITKMHTKVIAYSAQYFKLVKQQAMKTYETYKPIVKKQYKKAVYALKENMRKMNKQLKPYTVTIQTAVKDIQSGVPMKTALYPIYRQMSFATRYYQGRFMKMVRVTKSKICRADPKLCKYVKYSSKVHSFLASKYATRFNKYMEEYMEKYFEAKAKFYRLVRQSTQCFNKDRTTYRDVATIIGNKHVITFDKSLYNLAEIPSPSCEYILLNDFLTRDFTVTRSMTSLKIKTRKMTVQIEDNGKVLTSVPGQKIIKGLPMEIESAKCLRMQNVIVCHFKEQQMKVKIDLKNVVTTISVSGWHQGKLQGLLGTNNMESYDDMTLPTGKITTSSLEFINAYETTGNRKCQIKPQAAKALCGKRASPKCAKFFMDEKTSPFASVFGTLETQAFLEACIQDTVECRKNNIQGYCSSVNAFVQYARASGFKVMHVEECMKHGQRSIGSEWTTKNNGKQVDVVVMVSQRKTTKAYKKQIEKILSHLQKTFKNDKMDTRYSLVGFGGEGIREKAHTYALSDKVFGNIAELVREIASMAFNGKGSSSNDAYSAILKASRHHFRPSANREFILFNSEPHTSHPYGPTFVESLYSLTKEAGANLFVFDDIKLKNLYKKGRTLGLTTTKVFTSKFMKGFESSKYELPTSAFKEMIVKSNGGIFTNTIQRPKDASSILYNAITDSIKVNQDICKSCVVEKTWYGNPRAMCKSSVRQTC